MKTIIHTVDGKQIIKDMTEAQVKEILSGMESREPRVYVIELDDAFSTYIAARQIVRVDVARVPDAK